MSETTDNAGVLVLRTTTNLSPLVLQNAAREAVEEIMLEGQADNTRRSYETAFRYWCGWFNARYDERLTLPVPVPVVIQFIVDHLGRLKNSKLISELPDDLDKLLVDAGFKGQPGPLKINTVIHRLAVLSKIHQLHKSVPNPCADPQVRELMARSRRAATKRGDSPRQKTAATLGPLEAMLATCDGSLEGLRDQAILLFGWASGGRRRSEIAQANVEHLALVDDETYLFLLKRSKSQQDGTSGKGQAKPVTGRAALALTAWLRAARISEGPVFRRLWKDKVGPGLSPAAIAGVVKKHANLAGLTGDWAGHSLRSGFVSEAGKQSAPLGDVMAMTGHTQVNTLMRYYRAGELINSKASSLIPDRPAPIKAAPGSQTERTA